MTALSRDGIGNAAVVGSEFVRNASDINAVIRNRRLAVFQHVRRLSWSPRAPAPGNSAYSLHRTPSHGWMRKPGRPRHTSVRQITRECHLRACELWTSAGDRSSWRALRFSAKHGDRQQRCCRLANTDYIKKSLKQQFCSPCTNI